VRVPIFQIRDFVVHGSELYRIGNIRVDHGDTRKEPTYDLTIGYLHHDPVKMRVPESEIKRYQQTLI